MNGAGRVNSRSEILRRSLIALLTNSIKIIKLKHHHMKVILNPLMPDGNKKVRFV